MSDLIRREDAISALKALEESAPTAQHVSAIFDCEDTIRGLPSAEPEQKKGKWIDEKINSYTSRTYCSECGSSAPFVYESDDYYGNHAHGETAKTKFCPNCGADMRGE